MATKISKRISHLLAAQIAAQRAGRWLEAHHLQLLINARKRS